MRRISAPGAAFNNLPAETKKEMFVNVRTGHGGTTYDVKAGKRLKEFFDSIVVQPVPTGR